MTTFESLFPNAVYPQGAHNASGNGALPPRLAHIWINLNGVLQDHLSANPMDLDLIEVELEEREGEPVFVSMRSDGVIVAVRSGT